MHTHWRYSQIYLSAASIGVFGALALTVMGGIGLAVVSRHKNNRWLHARKMAEHERANAKYDDETRFQDWLTRIEKRHGLYEPDTPVPTEAASKRRRHGRGHKHHHH